MPPHKGFGLISLHFPWIVWIVLKISSTKDIPIYSVQILQIGEVISHNRMGMLVRKYKRNPEFGHSV